MENATKQIKEALLGGERLTTLDMLRRYRVMRGSSVIHKLRYNYGLPIKADIIDTPTGKRVAQYYIDGKEV